MAWYWIVLIIIGSLITGVGLTIYILGNAFSKSIGRAFGWY